MAFDGRSAGAARVSGAWMLLRTRRVAYCGLTAPTTTNRTGAREVEGVEGVEAVTVFTCPEVQHVEDMPTVTEPGARCMRIKKDSGPLVPRFVLERHHHFLAFLQGRSDTTGRTEPPNPDLQA